MKHILPYLLSIVILLSGCQTIYNKTMETFFGVEKRDLLVKSVKGVQKDQKEAQEEFKDALTQLKELYNFKGGDLEKIYNRLDDAYQDSSRQAERVHERIDNMNNIARSMFKEWNREIKDFENKSFAINSREKLEATRARYNKLYTSLKESAQTMNPVLTQLRDHVLYLKHNLNADSLGAFKTESEGIQLNIRHLIENMTRSIKEADIFIRDLR